MQVLSWAWFGTLGYLRPVVVVAVVVVVGRVVAVAGAVVAFFIPLSTGAAPKRQIWHVITAPSSDSSAVLHQRAARFGKIRNIS